LNAKRAPSAATQASPKAVGHPLRCAARQPGAAHGAGSRTRVFISHNAANTADARLLAVALVEQGSDIWFDEWHIRPEDSITAGIQAGLEMSNVFVLLWSQAAAKSHWVGAEISAYLHRRIEDQTLRIVPVRCDTTRLPTLVADYRGFDVKSPADFKRVATEIAGTRADLEIASILQRRLAAHGEQSRIVRAINSVSII